MSQTIVIRLEDVAKRYKIWRSPAARLRGPLLERLSRIALFPSGLRAFFRRRSERNYREFYALQDVSLQVAEGECLGIIGLNGSGKSTLLQIAAGIVWPTRGQVSRSGRTVALLELGSGFNSDFTGAENVYMNATILGLSKAEIDARFPKIADFAEIGDFMNQPVKTYSSGMVVRLAFAVLTQVEPKILIIDEALSVGDAYFQHKSIGHIRRFRESGGTVLFVSHDVTAVKSLCDRAILLDKGRVVREGEPDTVIDYYNAMIAKKEKDAEIRQVTNPDGTRSTRSGNGNATFQKVEILNAEREPASAFVAGETVSIRCLVRCRVTVDDPTIGFIIRDRYGNDIFGVNTNGLEIGPPQWQMGEDVEAEFELPLNLAPGSYSLSVSAHSAMTHLESNYDWIDRALIFEVVGDRKNRAIGCALLPVRGRVKKLALNSGARLEPQSSAP